jgi:signal transduction histidine kinase
LITLQAKLLDRNVRQGRRLANRQNGKTLVLVLQCEDLMFTAEAELPEAAPAPALNSLPIGSTVQVTGICFTESGEDKKLKSLQVLLPNVQSVQILKEPSWLTPQRLLMGLGGLFVALVVAVSWTVMVSKRNLVLKELVREKEKAQVLLQQAHDHLEERVQERTAQLKFQITARKESELQFKAVLRERTRLAQELHDTLEQTLTGIALQLDTASKLYNAKPESAGRHLELARNLVGQSHVEVRRSVWDLRSRALEQFDLQSALLNSGKQIAEGLNIHFEVVTRGDVYPLTETVEENLLRIAQEALTNVIKHSRATVVEIELDYAPQNVTMQIKDNGHGFQQENCSGPSEGHFGLLGISERAKRLGGEVVFLSESGAGTTVRVQVPIEQKIPTEDYAASLT